ncbi:MAG: hypothetical protein A2201_07890 [Alicyclobacillus sp. RIFOXYA1_FULL_53_8]|nr:MAG: hypothetical protein A2201_07890 [Alicyclobacillus sp. RIFOXYA1_FULL_53_8]
MLDLWNPEHLSLGIGLITALLLGIIHGITPDEHTWPITFSYAIGSYSTKGGMKAGFFFSAAFTLQRAIASQLAYFALAGFLMVPNQENAMYIVVGAVMFLSGYFILYRKKTFHLLPWVDKLLPPVTGEARDIPASMALIHGFVAGWGTGAFATIIYTVVAPTMPSPWLGWLPGVLFGLGTMVMQILIGAVFGRWIERRKLGEQAKALIGRVVAGNTLFVGGFLFVLVGAVGLAAPTLTEWSISTGLHVHNLDSINIGLVLVLVTVAGAGGTSLVRALKKVQSRSA